MQFPQLFRFVGYEKDLKCLLNVLPSFLEVFGCLVLNPESEFGVNGEEIELSKVLIKTLKSISSRTKAESSAVPAGMVPVYAFPVHDMHFAGSMYRGAVLGEKWRYIKLSQWSKK